MTSDQFGVWSFVAYLATLFVMVGGLFPFWALRFIARGKEGAVKTAVTANLVVGLIAVAIYLPLVPLILKGFNISPIYMIFYLLAALHMLNMYMISAFESCLQAIKPHTVGYGLIIEELFKVLVAYVLIVFLHQLFLGAIIGLISGEGVKALFYLWLVKGELKARLHWGYIREWLKGSTAFIYNAVGSQLLGLLLYLLVLFAGQTALGNYQAAVTFSTVIGFASSLTFALYPKMLARECRSDLMMSFKTMLMLAIPMATVAFTMSTSLLIILNASYAVAAPILLFLTVDGLAALILSFYTQTLLGSETFDEEGKIHLRKLVRSKIFVVFTVPYIQGAIALPAAFIVLTQFTHSDPIQAAISVVAINIAVRIISFVGLYVFMHKSVAIPVAWSSIAKYVLGGLISAIVLLLLPTTTTLVMTFGKIFAGIMVYFSVLYFIDVDARHLVRDVFLEIKGAFRKSKSTI
jgi:hypothetical protein